MCSYTMNINISSTVGNLNEVMQFLETKKFRAFSRIFGWELGGVPF